MTTPATWEAVNWLIAHEQAGILPDDVAQAVRGVLSGEVTLVDGSEVSAVLRRDAIAAAETRNQLGKMLMAGAKVTEIPDTLLDQAWGGCEELSQLSACASLLESEGILLCPWNALVVFPDKHDPSFYRCCTTTADAGVQFAGWEVQFKREYVITATGAFFEKDNPFAQDGRWFGPREAWTFEPLRLLFAVAAFSVRSQRKEAPNRVVRRRSPQLGGLVFTTVSMEFMRETVTEIHNSHPQTRGVRRHVVRGHPVVFRKPSGGKPNGFVGVTWRKAHVRGDERYGKVVKDYTVAPINIDQREENES